MRKRGFTLIEMLITVAVIAILMTITMRITTAGEQDQQRIKTQVRLHCLENCLSGYYAAFGAYPQVRLHGSRDIYRTIDSQTHSQTDTRDESKIVWDQVEAACRSQPIGARYPFNASMQKTVKQYVKTLQKLANSGKCPKLTTGGWAPIWKKGFDALAENAVGRFNADQRKATDWQQTKLFQFGLASFLLPRYLLMMGGDPELYEQMAQWNGQNKEPCDPLTGEQLTWTELHDLVKEATEGGDASVATMAHILNIPSQAVTARWMPNLEGMVVNDSWSISEVFGVAVGFGTTMPIWNLTGGKDCDVSDSIKASIVIPESGSPYILDSITFVDGFGSAEENYRGKEFYYYSPVPYQTYTIWSAGANGMTFPPWVSLDTIKKDATAIKTVTDWISDDIVRMSR